MPAKTILITGASDGIGAQTARTLAGRGHRLILVGRSPQKTEAVARELGADHYVCDFADLSQVATLAEQVQAKYTRIDVLANNAGGIMGPRTETGDGIEKTFQVNHLAPFLLTHLLMPLLEESRASVIQTASVAAKLFGRINLDDLQLTQNYTPELAYGNAKLANILFTKELQRRYGSRGISAAAFHPGVVGTSFASDTNHIMRYIYHTPLKKIATVSPEKGADQLIWLAEGTPGLDWEPGQFYTKRKPAKTNPQANDVVLQSRFWQASENLLGL